MAQKRVTIAQIAEIMDVSPITVSRALSDRPGVSDELRQRIKDKARELGYKKVRSNAVKSILLLIRRKFVVDNSNFSLIVQSLEHYIREAGMGFTMEFVEKEKQENHIVPCALHSNQRFDGVILLGQFLDDYAAAVQKQIPNMVILNGTSHRVDADFVYFDFNRAGYYAAQYLIEKGHRQIGFVGVEGRFNNCLRYMGYRRALEQAGIEVDERYVISKNAGLERIIQGMMEGDQLPTAFICNSDRTAIHLIKILHEGGTAIPQQVSVIGNGNTEMSSLTIPSLTTFDLNLDYACYVTVNTLARRIEQPETPEMSIFITPDFVERKSVQDVSL